MKESKTYFVDTNIFLRVLVKEDEKTFGDCFAFFKKIKEGEIKAITSSVVLAEINWVLGSFYKFSKNETIEALKSVLGLKGLKIADKYDLVLAISVYEKANIKFIDALTCSHLAVYGNKACIVSYDKDFDKLDVLRKEPREII